MSPAFLLAALPSIAINPATAYEHAVTSQVVCAPWAVSCVLPCARAQIDRLRAAVTQPFAQAVRVATRMLAPRAEKQAQAGVANPAFTAIPIVIAPQI